jgi:hypothetical protein
MRMSSRSARDMEGVREIKREWKERKTLPMCDRELGSW